MYKKKLSTIAIITILTLSILIAAIPMAYALPIAIDPLPTDTGPVGTQVTVSGTGATGFGLVEVYWDTLATKIKDGYADSGGVFSITKVSIPEDIVGDHDVIVFDVLSSTVANDIFTITPEVGLSTAKGLPGDSVTVTGTGFGDELEVGIYLGAITNIPAESVTITPGVSVTGTLAETPVVITTVDIATDVTITGLVGGAPIVGATATDISVTDDGEGNLAGTADVAVDDGVVTFSGTVTVTIAGTINYATGAITLTASGVDEGSGDAVTAIVVTIDACDADYDYAEYDVTPSAGVTTSDLGSFDAVILIPVIPEVEYGAYAVTAFDTDGNNAFYDPFIGDPWLMVDYYITVTPASGPTGITITISGRIKASTAYELRFNVATVATGTTDADGLFSNTYVIPSVLSTGLYAVTVVWDITESRAVTPQFEVTETPTITLGATSGVAGAVVTISGIDFSSGANITLSFGTTVVNSTALDSRFGPTGTFGLAGTFSEEFTVPTLAPGLYAVKVTDEYGASTAAIYSFTVLPTPVTTVALRATSYLQGDTLSFNIVTSETDLVPITVTVKDPAGVTWWTTAIWTLTGTTTVLYQDQLVNGNPLTLPADAPLGSWNWTVTYTPASTPVLTKATGLFTVAAPPTMQTVLDQLDTMEASIKSVVTTSEGKIIVAVNTKAGEIITDLDALGAKLQGLEDLGVVIATDVDDIQIDLASLDLTVLDALGVDITAIKGDVATIKSNIGTVTTAVSALDAKVTSLSGDVATVSTTLGTLQGTVTSIDGNIATIDTEVGTLQADIADIDLDVDMTPAWIAVVLSLVAAIAAVFAVITIRQKIAG